MNALVLANFPMAILVILAIVGIPLWMTSSARRKPGLRRGPCLPRRQGRSSAVPAQAAARSHAVRVTQPHRAAA